MTDEMGSGFAAKQEKSTIGQRRGIATITMIAKVAIIVAELQFWQFWQFRRFWQFLQGSWVSPYFLVLFVIEV
jgi:hypothetical protein